jgi:hypothetical protein
MQTYIFLGTTVILEVCPDQVMVIFVSNTINQFTQIFTTAKHAIVNSSKDFEQLGLEVLLLF